jgi:ribosome maturation factor RimP
LTVGEGLGTSDILPLPSRSVLAACGRPFAACHRGAGVSWIVGSKGCAAGIGVRTTQDEELAVTERSAGLPSPKQVIELLDGEFARAGYEIEDVVIDTAARPPRITVIADGDEGLDLDAIAELSRSASALLDRVDEEAAAYVLEVTSPGVERPLTTEKHYRRARGRKVELTLSDGSQLTGRLGEIRDGAVRLVVREGNEANLSVRELPVDAISKAIVQIEFSPPNQRELELAGQSGKEVAG